MKIKKPVLARSQKVKKLSKKAIVFGLVLTIFMVAGIFVTIQTSASGATLAELEKQESQLTYENEELSKQLIGGFSLTEAEGRSEELGFIKPEKIIYLSKSAEVAKLP